MTYKYIGQIGHETRGKQTFFALYKVIRHIVRATASLDAKPGNGSTCRDIPDFVQQSNFPSPVAASPNHIFS